MHGLSDRLSDGVTVYDPERQLAATRCSRPRRRALLIDMSGREVQLWQGPAGLSQQAACPAARCSAARASATRATARRTSSTSCRSTSTATCVWRFDRLEHIGDPGESAALVRAPAPRLPARGQSGGLLRAGAGAADRPRQHAAPGARERARRAHLRQAAPRRPIVEVDWDGDIIWQWRPHEHFEELGFDAAARRALRDDPNVRAPGAGALGAAAPTRASAIGCTSTRSPWSGPNRWYDAGDARFHPDNLIWDAREANIIAIVDKRSGQDRLEARAALRRQRGGAPARLDHRPAPRAPDPAAGCPAPATCSCSTTAAGLVTASPTRARRTGSRPRSATTRACSRSIRSRSRSSGSTRRRKPASWCRSTRRASTARSSAARSGCPTATR